MTDQDKKTVLEARKLLGEIIRDFIIDSPAKGKYMYGSHKEMTMQYLKPLWDVCYLAGK